MTAPTIIRAYSIELQTYHDEIIGRLAFTRDDGTREGSALYSLSELTNILALWRMGGLLGSFGIGTVLAATAEFELKGPA